MRNTTRPTILAPESIHSALLAGVNGGCRPKCPAPAPEASAASATVNNFQLINLGCGGTPPTPPAQTSSEPEVETTVSYSAAGATARA